MSLMTAIREKRRALRRPTRVGLPLLTLAISLLAAAHAWAGPPFVTDDPEPVDLHHWEVYVSSIYLHDASGTAGTLPHIEVNNGAAPNLQLHIIVPYAFAQGGCVGPLFGVGDMELGFKYRFLQEAKNRPMAGIFPLLEVPTGNAERGLGSGHLLAFLPVWLQKSWGPWTSYGGGGYWINPGGENYWLTGWLLQKDLSRALTLGGELFYTTPSDVGASSQFNFNLGGQYNFDEGHHLLFSAGRSLHGDIQLMTYVGYQWTFGPREPAEAGSGGQSGGSPSGSSGPTGH
jgi:hypothetical protein